MSRNNLKINILRIINIILGTLLMSLSINLFLVPHGLLSGGVTGISIVLQYLTNINSGIYILLLNIPIFIIGLRYIDKEFAIVSLFGMLSLSFFVFLTNDLSSKKIISDLLASTIYGGLLTGLGSGIIFKNRASTGGTDIISVVIKRNYEIKISTLMFSMNLVIVLIGGLIKNPTLAIYTLISIFIASNVMNKILVGFDSKKLLFIVTDRDQELSQELLKTIKRGVTLFYGEGAYTGNKKKVIYCVITARQLSQVKTVVNSVDPKAFISVLDTSEIQGKGFKRPAL